MDKSQKDEYLGNPLRCPYCKSYGIILCGNHMQGDTTGSLHGIMKCGDCDQIWIDDFKLIGVYSEEEYSIKNN